MADEAIYRCINAACGRPAPRPVPFCPWCGTAQGRAGARAGGADAAAGVAAASAGAGAAAATPGWSDAPAGIAPATSPAPAPASTKPAPAPSATAFGHSGQGAAPVAAGGGSAAAPGAALPPHQEVPRPPLAPHPPRRKPIRLRWWLLALAVLWGLWQLASPSAKKVERRIDAAIALARECKGSEAQGELIALRKSRASQEQLQRLQQALNDEAAKCSRRRQRARAWNDASAAVQSALAAAGWDKAKARLQAFTRRWGEDEDTRALKTRIEDAHREDAAQRSHPLAAPEGALGSSGAGAAGAGTGSADSRREGAK